MVDSAAWQQAEVCISVRRSGKVGPIQSCLRARSQSLPAESWAPRWKLLLQSARRRAAPTPSACGIFCFATSRSARPAEAREQRAPVDRFELREADPMLRRDAGRSLQEAEELALKTLETLLKTPWPGCPLDFSRSSLSCSGWTAVLLRVWPA